VSSCNITSRTNEYCDEAAAAERPEAQANLGNLYFEQGKLDASRACFKTALELDRCGAARCIN
jgi:tetratricopeptide (TPR) repeat protein